MSRSVWKYEIPVDDQWHPVPTPLPAVVVNVDSKGALGTVAVWAEVTTNSGETSKRRMRAFGTGQPIPKGAVYVGTALAGPLVWHIYAEAPGDDGE